MSWPSLTYLFLYLFIGATVIQCIYWGIIFSKWLFDYNKLRASKTTVSSNKEPVSIIICAKNEAENLKKKLPLILAQTYEKYEVIVVNDHSQDNTLKILEYYNNQFDYFRIVDFSEPKLYASGKKEALDIGIRSARYDWILVTDADCEPAGTQWLAEMMAARHHQPQKKWVLGYSPYLSTPKVNVLNEWIRFETTVIALQYMNWALWGQPYMGVGRNMLYKKSIYLDDKTPKSHWDLASGDDDLSVQKLAKGRETTIAISAESVVWSAPQSTVGTYYKQKSRHLTTAHRYKRIHIIGLGLFSLSHFVHYAALFVLVILQFGIIFGVVGYTVRLLLVTIQCVVWRHNFREPTRAIWYPLLDLMFIGYYLRFLPSLFDIKVDQWK